jgi:hypothetical protein
MIKCLDLIDSVTPKNYRQVINNVNGINRPQLINQVAAQNWINSADADILPAETQLRVD